MNIYGDFLFSNKNYEEAGFGISFQKKKKKKKIRKI